MLNNTLSKITLETFTVILFVVLAVFPKESFADSKVHIVLQENAGQIQQLAAKELELYLQQMYPDQSVEISSVAGKNEKAILLKTTDTFANYQDDLDTDISLMPDGFMVSIVSGLPGRVMILGEDARAVLHGVYGLLEHLGCGFYLSDEIIPEKSGCIDFKDWKLEKTPLLDAPLVPERIVFNWHNFLSGCTGWDLEDWKRWIYSSARMRYTDIMVHAYKNNPMQPFRHNHIEKQVGYIATSAKGRDWSTMHLNDVRRIPGCSDLFDGAVFGSAAAMVPDEKRVAAATSLMNDVFDYAKSMAMQINFAIDVDTGDDPRILATLPADAKFEVENGKVLVNPDTPQGYRYYRDMAKSLLQIYPQIDRLVVWHRWKLGTDWTKLDPNDFPNDRWRNEFSRIVAKNPHLSDDPYAGGQYGISRIVKAFSKALDELGHDEVELAVGSWKFEHLKAADVFMPDGIPLIVLDHGIEFDSEKIENLLSSLKHDVVPILWAQHDDGQYLGRPFTPFSDFMSKLQARKASGFGIIHWTMRPLDLYFKSLAEQVWINTKDRPLIDTCRSMAARIFRSKHRKILGDYLYNWVTSAPVFGRETMDFFMWGTFADSEKLLKLTRKRLDTLNSIQTSAMSDEQIQNLHYFKDFEKFCMDFIVNQNNLWEAKNYFNSKFGNLSGYRTLVERLEPRSVIEQYAKAIKHGKTTKGEKGLASTLATQWLPYFIEQRQLAALEPVRINFYPTHHEKVAQMPGKRTFFIDKDGGYWRCDGQQETKHEVFVDSAQNGSIPKNTLAEIAETGLRIVNEFNYSVTSILHGQTSYGKFIQGVLSPGKYRFHLLFRKGQAGSAGENIFDLKIPSEGLTEKIAIENCESKNNTIELTYPVSIKDSTFSFSIKPHDRAVLLCGVWLEPLGVSLPEPRGFRIRKVTSNYKSSSSRLTFDGNIKTCWSSKKKDAYVEYDFGRVRQLAELRIAWTQDYESPTLFEVEVSNDGQKWKRVYNGMSSGYTNKMENYTLDKLYPAQFVRIRNHNKSNDSGFSISEVEFHKEATPVPNGLRIYDVQASDMASPEFSPERAIDTDKRTRWAAQGSNNWIKFRLNNSATIKKMCIHWYKGHRRKYIFDIEISTDGKNWKKISSQTSKVKEGKEVYEIEPTKASWVRLLCKGNNGNDWSSINEIEIHGKPETN